MNKRQARRIVVFFAELAAKNLRDARKHPDPRGAAFCQGRAGAYTIAAKHVAAMANLINR
jgi:hypothetical protein